MSLQLVVALAQIERSDDFHLGRLLLLLRAVAGRSQSRPIEGIMKLAKMDFLLRYPNALARVLQAVPSAEQVVVPDYELRNIEAKMIRFRYGPWDDRYRRWIGLMVAKGLASTQLHGRTVRVALTGEGGQVAQDLAHLEEFQTIDRRAQSVQKAVGAMSATKLTKFIYETFPELSTMKWGEEISV
jgi:hypothetical protein